MDFSKDQELVAVGTTESYIRVWSLDGKALKSRLGPEKDMKVNNRKLIGHSAPVYSVAFSDAVANLDRNIYEGSPQPETDTKLLLSCSADGQVRLWSLEVGPAFAFIGVMMVQSSLSRGVHMVTTS